MGGDSREGNGDHVGHDDRDDDDDDDDAHRHHYHGDRADDGDVDDVLSNLHVAPSLCLSVLAVVLPLSSFRGTKVL